MKYDNAVTTLYCPIDMLKIIDGLYGKSKKYHSRNDILVEAIEEWLVNHGHLKPQPESKVVMLIHNTTTI